MNNQSVEEIIDEYSITRPVEISLRSYTDWLLGISLGLGGVMISLLPICKTLVILYIVQLIISFLILLFAGFIKYKMHLRNLIMGASIGGLKKLQILRKAQIQANKTPNDEDIKQKWFVYYNRYAEASNNIKKIGNWTNILSKLIVLNIIGVGIVVILYSYINAG